jgi:23S rRNA (adenine2503-C2)-methyltransferase
MTMEKPQAVVELLPEVKRFDDPDGNVWKYVFHFEGAVAEAVLYRYSSFYTRTVLCISVQSGCPVGCKFCGTGAYFVRNLSSQEIIVQVQHCLADMNIEDVDQTGERFQIMFMSMGEPLLNMGATGTAIRELHAIYPKAELLVSTIGPINGLALVELFKVSKDISKIGLQFSIHEAWDDKRNKLIPYIHKYELRDLRNIGIEWERATGRPVFLNYCVHADNHSQADLDRLKDLFPPAVFRFTFSVICSADETMKTAGYRNMELLNQVQQQFLADGYDVRIFDPAGQDTIGGGCGQLFYVQQWLQRGGATEAMRPKQT